MGRKFVLAEAQHTGQQHVTEMAGVPAPSQEAISSAPLSLKQLGLKNGLPRNPVPGLRFLTFNAWWTESGTKRYMELCFDLDSELFQVVLDKTVNVLDAKVVYNSN